MQIILTEDEYTGLRDAKEKALELVRQQCQTEFEKAKDEFLQDLLDSCEIREAFAGLGGQARYEGWRARTRILVKKLNMPK